MSEKSQIRITDNYQLKSIEQLDFAYYASKTKNELDPSFKVRMQNRIHLDSKLLHFVIHIELYADARKHLLAAYSARVVFEYFNPSLLVEHSDAKKNTITLQHDSQQHMMTVALSIVRGMMFQQFKGVIPNTIFLPLYPFEEIEMI